MPNSIFGNRIIKQLRDLRAADVDDETDISHHGIQGMKWGVRNGPPYPLTSISNGNAVLLKNYDGPAYFISEKKLSTLTLEPRIPDNFLTKNGYEDSETPRVSFAPSIDKCLAGLSQNLDDKTFYVYEPVDISKCDVYKPNEKAVPDSKITDELWITNPVELKPVKKIKITGNRGSDGKNYIYGDHEATLYDDWTYEDVVEHSSIFGVKTYIHNDSSYLKHHGIKGMKWGVRRYQNSDGSLTPEGEKRYSKKNLKKAKVRNLHKWGKDPDHNVLYIIGNSGSGKSTTARGMASENDSVIHIDTLLEKEAHGSPYFNKDFENFLKSKNVDIDKARDSTIDKKRKMESY